MPDVATRRLGEDEAYFYVRDILSEVSTVADGALLRERSGFYRFGFATLGSNQELASKRYEEHCSATRAKFLVGWNKRWATTLGLELLRTAGTGRGVGETQIAVLLF